MSTREQFLATKSKGTAIGATDPLLVIGVEDPDGNAATLLVDVDGKLITSGSGGGGGSDASAANQVTGNNTLASILAKIIAAPSTEAKQDTGNTSLASILAKISADPATQTTLAAVLAKLSADPATQTTLAAVLAKMIAAPATEAKQDALTTVIGAVTASPTANTLMDRVKALLTGIVLSAGSAIIGKISIDQTTPGTTNQVAANGYGFDVAVTPAVTNGAYSPNDIMGGLMTFTVARVNDEAVFINEIQIAFKSAVTPSLLLVLLEADPTGTTKTDNAAYSLAAADVFKVRAALPVNNLGGYLTDHGTPNTIRLPGLSIPMKPVSGGKDIYMLMVDLTGVTLTSTSDVQVRVCGLGA